MKLKKIPMRTCVVTREKFPKGELLRIVRTPEGEIKIDESGKLNGRGVYIKKDPEVVKLAKQRNSLGRSLETSIADGIYEEITKMIK